MTDASTKASAPTASKITPWTWLSGIVILAAVGVLASWYMARREVADLRFGEDLAWLELPRATDIVAASQDLPDFDFLDAMPALEVVDEAR